MIDHIHSPASTVTSVQEGFEQRVALHPDAPAVFAADGECWSYSHLNEFSNQIAHRLLQRGIGREERVGVCMQRSPETVGVLLGILKARAAYVPLDLNLPDERLLYIVEDAAINHVFVDTPGQAKLDNARVKNVESLSASTNAGFPNHSPELQSHKSDLANILYTSGSTGKPKGAMLEHSGVLRLVVDTKWLTFSPTDVFLQISALSFDLSTFEVWGPLLNGGSVVTAPQSPSLDEIGRLLEEFKVTTLWLTAGLFNVLMDERPNAIAKIKHLLTGGDIASPRHAREALMHLEHGELLNCYGPTENATFSTCHRVKMADTGQPSIPIGVPVDKSPVYLLDESMQPIHDLRVGEVFVGGEGLARGYWNRPELTAEKFLQLEIKPGVVERLYRTGDLGRYNEAGLLEFVGRTDFQLKIRGFRIEPEEIELALSSMPGLASAAIVAKGRTAETKKLYCYYIQGVGPETSPAALEAFLRSKFPDYMIPAAFVKVQTLPLNTNGKVDRKALEGVAAAARADREITEPKTGTEAALLEIWTDLLAVQNVSLDDSFFALGGDSLLAARLFAQVQKRFSRQLPLSVILYNSTVRKLAALIDNDDAMSDRASLVPLNRCDATKNLFLVHPVGGSVLTYKRLGELLPTRAVYGLDAERILGQTATNLSIEQIANRYVEAIRKRQPAGPYLVGGFSAGGVISFEIARQLQEAGQMVEPVIIIDSRLSPSLRAVLLGFRFRELFAVLGRIRRQYPILIRRFGLRKFLERNWNDLRTARRMATRSRANVAATISGANTPDLAESILMAHDRYVPKPFKGRAVLYTTAETMAANERVVSEWEHLLLEGVYWKELPGNHSNLLHDPQIGALAEDLARVLAGSVLAGSRIKAENPTTQLSGGLENLIAG